MKKLGPVFNFKLGPALTLKPPNLGPVLTLQHIYIYAYAEKLKIGPRFGGFKAKIGPSSKLNIGPIFHCFPLVLWCCLGMFENTNSATLCQNSVFAKLLGCQK